MDTLHRHNVRVSGPEDASPIVFAHGFGCDQEMWRHVVPSFTDDHRVVLFDYVGCGGSDDTAFDPDRHATLDGWADDVAEIITELDLRDIVFVGHSVSAMIGVITSIRMPERFAGLVLVGPSPRYVDDGDYVGGFSRPDIDDLLDSLESNYLGWSRSMAPVIMDNPDRPELGEELADAFCRVEPAIARVFARATFLADNRTDLPQVSVPTLVVQSAHDAIAPLPVGEFVHRNIPNSALEVLDVVGHCPNLSAPDLTASAIRRFVDGLGERR